MIASSKPTQYSRDEYARWLAMQHLQQEDYIERIQRIRPQQQRDAEDLVILLEVNPETFPAGVMPIYFGTDEHIHYPTVLIELTPDEFEKLQQQELQLPEGWELGEVIFSRDQAA